MFDILISQVSADTVQGNIVIPVWLIVTVVTSLVAAVVFLFKVIVDIYEKRITALKESHDDQIKILKDQVESKIQECDKLEKKLDERHDQMNSQTDEMGRIIDIAHLVVNQMRPGFTSESTLETNMDTNLSRMRARNDQSRRT